MSGPPAPPSSHMSWAAHSFVFYFRKILCYTQRSSLSTAPNNGRRDRSRRGSLLAQSHSAHTHSLTALSERKASSTIPQSHARHVPPARSPEHGLVVSPSPRITHALHSTHLKCCTVARRYPPRTRNICHTRTHGTQQDSTPRARKTRRACSLSSRHCARSPSRPRRGKPPRYTSRRRTEAHARARTRTRGGSARAR